ncbi:MAG: SUMF1/EgtB/PvdO family nonheme iron enzyme [bacterium]|nr:SUMF1/EgtB/PvdO family nonheme iron enzyme [bacterium]
MPHLRLLFFILLLASLSDGLRAQATGNNYAHFFYVTDFQPGWEDLPETGREARNIGQVLESDYNFTVQYHREVEKADILQKIAEINSRKYGKNDQVLFFFSMHGHFDKSADRGYLVPADGKIPRLDAYGQTWLSYDDLGSYITKNPAEHVLLALDACYSGAFGDRYKGAPDALPWEGAGDCQQKAQLALQHDSRLYFSSGSREQRTPANSLFAKKWLEALRNGARTGLVTSRDLRYYLGGISYPTPEGGSFTSRHEAGGDFVFLHRSACQGSNSSDGTDAAEEQLWAQAQRLKTKEAYAFYLQAYPNGRYRAQAEAKIKVFEQGETITPSSTTRRRDLPDMLFVEGGTFQMGSSDSDAGSDEKPHTVTVDDFYLHRFEVTNSEFAEFLNAKGRHEYNGAEWYDLDDEDARIEQRSGTYTTKGSYGKHPVTEVTWYGAVAYCNWKSEALNLQPVYRISGTNVSADWNADGYRLPTEAEWEFAARSRGKDYKYAWGNGKPNGNIADESAKKENSGWTIWEGYDDGYPGTAPVGMFEQGTLGFSDLSGNVWEWCWDWYDSDYYKNSPSRNPRGPSTGSYRVPRGGSWGDAPAILRCANRSNRAPGRSSRYIGFRLSRAGR